MSGFVAVHTGAGNSIVEALYKSVCEDACMQGVNVLRSGGSALDACEMAITALEDACSTNAGFGSNLTWNGLVQCDASIMDGTTLQYGACTNVSDVKNPISLARQICERQSKLLSFGRIPPMVLSGTGASEYAKQIGLQIVPQEKMIAPKASHSYTHYWKSITEYEKTNQVKLSPLDTVGAICVDADGAIVAGCSSGGLLLKISGRVGQAATYGAGCWALIDEANGLSAATCTTGNGEFLMKTLFAKELVEDLINCNCPITSQNQTYQKKLLNSPFLANQKEIFAGSLSMIYNSSRGSGDVLWAHTTNSMCLGLQSTRHKKPKCIVSKLPLNVYCGGKPVVSGHHFKLH
ncbi:threonine aspartase 1 [Sabethes cyaneus]|uniref:threonine aspartase 1 n=1 Tax=Sabethes cyaneus TaxID=53552 RepID=UPI00237DA4D5|nr:threonine aspartase 1 [Sabethes cyaneus]